MSSCTITIKSPDGTINDLRNVELVAIDGIPFEGLSTPDLVNHEDRIRSLEQHTVAIMSFLQDKFPEDTPQESEPFPQ